MKCDYVDCNEVSTCYCNECDLYFCLSHFEYHKYHDHILADQIQEDLEYNDTSECVWEGSSRV